MRRILIRICLLLCVLILSAVASNAKTITVPAQTLGTWQRTSAPLVYIFSDKTYLAVDYPSAGVNTIIFAGSPNNLNAFKKVTCTLLSGTVTIPSFTIPSTIDGQDATDARLSFYLYDGASKAKIGPIGDYVNLAIPDFITSASICSPIGTCATLSDLKIYNNGAPILPAPSYYNKREVDQKIAGTVSSGLQDPGSNGIVIRTGIMTTAARSIAVGANLSIVNPDGTGGNPTISLSTSVPVATLGTANQILGVNNAASANEYKTLSVGTSGTDFLIVHGAGTIAFNLPTASASNRGALSSADWSTFNGKQTGDAGLTALAAFNTNGFMVQTALDTFAGRTLQTTANQIGITNPAGTAGDPTFSLAGPHNFTTLTLNGVLYGNTTSAIQATAQGAANSVLTANAGAPIFSSTPTVDRAIVNPSAFVYDLNTSSLATAFLIGTGPATPLSINVPTGKVLTGFQFNAGNTGQGKLVGFDVQLSASGATQDIEPIRLMLGRVTNSGTGNQKTTAIRVGSTGSGSNASLLIGVDVDITPASGTNNASTVFAATVEGTTDDVGTGMTFQQGASNPRWQQVVGSIAPIKVNAAFYRAWMGTGSSANARSFQALNNAGTELFYVDTSANLLMAGVQIVGTNPAQSGQIRIGNNVNLSARNAANGGDFALVKLNASNELEFGASGVTMGVINQGVNPYFQVGPTASGWLFQKVDTDNRLRFFRQAGGEFFAISAAGVTNLFLGGAVASAGTITITGNVFHVTGTTNITSVSGTGIAAGTTITIIFDGILTFTDGSNLKLAGNFVTTADDTITLTYDGTNWFEVARAVN